MYQKRLAEKNVFQALKQFPIIAILGARQVGKSTLAQKSLRGFDYFDLENATDFDRFQESPLLLLESSDKIVLDEVQRIPSLFPLLRSLIDKYPQKKVVLLGSATPSLIKQISESLAGRVGFVELSPILCLEEEKWKKLWIQGSFPRLHWSHPQATPEQWYPSYLRTLIERDIPQLGFRLPAPRMRKLLQMIAHMQGQVCNLSELGESLGVSYHTVQHFLDVFEGTFLIRRLQPYFSNLKKRLVKSPKIYIRDTGLFHSLLGIPHSEKALLRHPKVGASFESYWIEQIIQLAQLKNPGAEGFFWRTHAGAEVDLLLRLKEALIPIEIKLTTAHPELKSLKICMNDLKLKKGYVLTQTLKSYPATSHIEVCSPMDLLKKLKV